MILNLVEQTYSLEDIDAMIDVLKSDKFTMGDKVKEFEMTFAKKFNFNYCVMVNSGSSANLLSLCALSNSKRSNHFRSGDRVLVPSVCWSTSVYPIIQNNLIPIFMDVNPDTLNINAEDIEKYDNIRGIVLVHILGNSTNMDKVMDIVKKKNLIVMEDTCESLSSKYGDKYLGGFGDMGSFSFYFSHHITTIEGGMVTCKTLEDYNYLLSIRAHGWTRHENIEYPDINKKFCFINIGYNLRPMETQGAMGIVQLKHLDDRNIIRNTNYYNIKDAILNDYRNYNIFTSINNLERCEPSWFAIALFLNKEYNEYMKDFIDYLDKNGIANRPIVTGNFTRQPVIKYINNDIDPIIFKGAEYIHNNGFYIGCPTNKNLSKLEIDKIVNIFYSFPKFKTEIKFYKSPFNIEKSIPFVTDAIKSSWISIFGKYIDTCEKKLQDIVGCKYIILTLTGTAALDCMIRCLKYKYPNCKKIYVPNNTYIACINILLKNYDISMIECLDVDSETLNIENVNNLEKNAALFVIHNIGGITNIARIRRDRPDLIILEDNSEGYMGEYESYKTGSLSFVSCMSFNMNKNLTSGQGGAFCTNNKELYDYIISYTRHGISHEKFNYKMDGNNYRMSNVTAAILLSQIEQIDNIMLDKIKTYNIYKNELLNCDKIKLQKISEDTKNSYWNIVIRVIGNPSYLIIRDYLRKYNIETRPMFLPLQNFPYLKKLKFTKFTNSQLIANEYIFVPFNCVNENNIKYICSILKKYINYMNSEYENKDK